MGSARLESGFFLCPAQIAQMSGIVITCVQEEKQRKESLSLSLPSTTTNY